MYEKDGIVLSCKMTHLKFVCVVSITASEQVIQVIKVDIKSPDIVSTRKDDK